MFKQTDDIYRTYKYFIHAHSTDFWRFSTTSMYYVYFEKYPKNRHHTQNFGYYHVIIHYTAFMSLTILQNATKVQIKLPLNKATFLTPTMKEKLAEKCSHVITRENCILVASEDTRSQFRNYQDAKSKLSEILWEALEKPDAPKHSEDELEAIRKGKIRANKKRLKDKRMRSMTLRNRKCTDWWFKLHFYSTIHITFILPYVPTVMYKTKC